MLTVEEALRAVLDRVAPLPSRRVALSEALGCVLAEDVKADIDLPPFDKSIVDGYAVRSSDLSGENRRLRIGEEIAAGTVPTRPIHPGEAAVILTGAPMPEGADAVVMIERTNRVGSLVEIDSCAVTPGQNRLLRGREMRAGDVVLACGDVLNPLRLGLLASVGRPIVRVIPRPGVAVVSTGDELVEPNQMPGPGQIRNSNATMFRALATSSGVAVESQLHVRDDPEALHEVLGRGLAADVLLISGGVSAGKRDLVPGALERLGVAKVFHKIRLKPGKPLWFGIGPARRDDGAGTLVFGLPGNPVSGVVGFLLFARPALRVLAGLPVLDAATISARLGTSFTHAGNRPSYHPARLSRGSSSIEVIPMAWGGSADLRTVASADGFAVFPAGDRCYQKGEIVEFVPLG